MVPIRQSGDSYKTTQHEGALGNDTVESKEVPVLLAELWKVLREARAAFGQEHVFPSYGLSYAKTLSV